MGDGSEVELTVTISNSRPVELTDLGKSFEALGELYEAFVHDKGFEGVAGNAKLFVVDVQKGSIIATLRGLLDQASFVIDHVQVLAGFMTNLHDLIEFFRIQSKPKPDDSNPSRVEAQRFAELFEPIAKDGSAQINFSVSGPITAPVIINNIVVNSERANAIQNNVRRYLGPVVPEDGRFEREVMYLQQMRGDTKSSIGDRGVIEKFSKKPVKLHFMSPEVKAAIIDKPQNPFRMAYVVDGITSTAKGEPALYKIVKVHESLGPRLAHRNRAAKAAKRKKGKPKAA